MQDKRKFNSFQDNLMQRYREYNIEAGDTALDKETRKLSRGIALGFLYAAARMHALCTDAANTREVDLENECYEEL